MPAFNAAIVNANSHANRQRAVIHHAVAHEHVRRLFLAGLFRHVRRNLYAGVAALRRFRVRIARRPDALHRIVLLFLGIAHVRQQIRTASVVVSIFAECVLERLANRKHLVGFDHRNSELVVTQRIAAPSVCNAVIQGFTQVPVVHAPHHDAARREPRIVGIEPDNKPARLFIVLSALALHTNTILEHKAQAIYRHRTDACVRILSGLVHHKNTHFARFVPAALAVFDQQVFACVQRHLHNFGFATRTRSSNIHRHRLTCNRANFLHLAPAHVCAFPRRRHRRHEPVTRIVAREIHHVVITEAANSLRDVESIGHTELAPNLVHHNAVDTPVEAILRGSLAHHHHRMQRIGSTARNVEAARCRIAIAHDTGHRLHHLALCRIGQQVAPVLAGNIHIHKVTRSIGALRAHATAIEQAACTRMYNHVGALHVRVLRKRNAERSLFRGILRSGGNRVVHEREVVAATRLVELGSLLALLFARAVVIDNLLVERVRRRTRRRAGENTRIDDHVPATHRAVVIFRELKMLEPVSCSAPAARRV